MQVGRADLERAHAAFAGQEAGERDFQLAVGEEEQRLPRRVSACGGDGLAGAGAGGGGDGVEQVAAVTPNSAATACSQSVVPSSPKGKGAGSGPRAAAHQRGMGIAQEGLGQGEDGVRPDGRRIRQTGGRAGTRTGPMPMAASSASA